MHPSPAVAEGRGKRAVDRPDPTAAGTLNRSRLKRRHPGRGARLLNLLLDLVLKIGDVGLEVVDVRVDLVERGRLRVTGGRELGLASLELGTGAHELGLLRLDLVAVVGDPVDGDDRSVAKVAHAADDRGVLLLDAPQVLVAREQVVEPVGLEHHGHEVGLAGAIDADEAVAKDVQRTAKLRAEDLELVLFAG